MSMKRFSVIMAAVLLLLHFTSCASSSAEPSIEAVESSAEKESGEKIIFLYLSSLGYKKRKGGR